MAGDCPPLAGNCIGIGGQQCAYEAAGLDLRNSGMTVVNSLFFENTGQDDTVRVDASSSLVSQHVTYADEDDLVIRYESGAGGRFVGNVVWDEVHSTGAAAQSLDGVARPIVGVDAGSFEGAFPLVP